MKKIYILSLFLLILCFSSCSTSKTYDINEYRTTMQYHDDFKILQLTDIHLGIETDLKRQLNILNDYINEADPDLIILTGDNFMYACELLGKQLTEHRCHGLSTTTIWAVPAHYCY